MTAQRIDPKVFGLHHSTVIEVVDEQTLALVVKRKSRLIMKDGKKLLAKAARIREVRPDVRVILRSSAPICSKTRRMLEEALVPVHLMEPPE